MSKSSRAKRRFETPSEEAVTRPEMLASALTREERSDSDFPRQPAFFSRHTAMAGVIVLLSLFVLGVYARIYDPHDGWTKMAGFGEQFEKDSLPRLQRSPHYVEKGPGYDGQFYAQLAIDPSVQDPAFGRALDEPVYRARRIGMPAIAFCLGGAKPRRIIQAYALINLLCWFVLLGALVPLSRPWTGRQLFCMSLGLLSFGSVASMEHSFVDLPATAMIFVGIVLGGWGGYAAFAAAALTRETSLLAALGSLDLRRPWTVAGWKRNVGLLAVASVPILLWMLYLRAHFGGAQTTAGYGNFGWPLQALAERFASGMDYYLHVGLSQRTRAGGPFGWLTLDDEMHEMLTVVGLFCQGLYLACRWNPSSAIWRTGICFALLGCILGPAVWEWTGAAARVLLPMTLCFYLLVAREREAWFWPFFVLGSLSVPWAVHDFWMFS